MRRCNRHKLLSTLSSLPLYVLMPLCRRHLHLTTLWSWICLLGPLRMKHLWRALKQFNPIVHTNFSIHAKSKLVKLAVTLCKGRKQFVIFFNFCFVSTNEGLCTSEKEEREKFCLYVWRGNCSVTHGDCGRNWQKHLLQTHYTLLSHNTRFLSAGTHGETMIHKQWAHMDSILQWSQPADSWPSPSLLERLWWVYHLIYKDNCSMFEPRLFSNGLFFSLKSFAGIKRIGISPIVNENTTTGHIQQAHPVIASVFSRC